MIPIRLPGLAPFGLHVHDKPDRFISAELRRRGVWEPFESRMALALLDPGEGFVDLGANLGYYTLLAAARVGAQGRGFAFEPDPDNFALLERNLAAGRATQVRAERCAVGAVAGESRLYLSPDNLGDHRLYDSGDGRRAVSTPVVTLDGYFGDPKRFPRGAGALHLVKADTQGCEALILRGAQAWAAEQGRRLCWLLEFWPFGLAGCGTGPEELLERLSALDVHLAMLREDTARAVPTDGGTLARLARDGLHPETGRFCNLVAVPRANPERWARVLALA
jgi:FkbM family methyltransferase